MVSLPSSRSFPWEEKELGVFPADLPVVVALWVGVRPPAGRERTVGPGRRRRGEGTDIKIAQNRSMSPNKQRRKRREGERKKGRQGETHGAPLTGEEEHPRFSPPWGLRGTVRSVPGSYTFTNLYIFQCMCWIINGQRDVTMYTTAKQSGSINLEEHDHDIIKSPIIGPKLVFAICEDGYLTWVCKRVHYCHCTSHRQVHECSEIVRRVHEEHKIVPDEENNETMIWLTVS